MPRAGEERRSVRMDYGSKRDAQRFEGGKSTVLDPNGHVRCINCGVHWMRHSYTGMLCPSESEVKEHP